MECPRLPKKSNGGNAARGAGPARRTGLSQAGDVMQKYLAVNEAANLTRLDASYRDQIRTHMLGLEPDARYMRFGNLASDAFISRYVDAIDVQRDLVLGWLYDHGQLLAVVHLAHVADDVTEFSISIVESLRGAGHGQQLTHEALRIAREIGYETACLQFLKANRPMAAIVDHFANTRKVDGTECLVDVPLPAKMERPFNAPLRLFVFGGLAF